MILGERKQRILAAVVRDYVDTVRPIGSEDLAVRHASWGVKSATIRNELAELSNMGLLMQPHTSAGRIPSDMGYRFYVDNVIDSAASHNDALSSLGNWDPGLELDRLLRHTCALLTRMTSYTAVATPPRPADTQIQQIFLSPASSDRLLLVILLSSGQTENRLLTFAGDIPAPELAAVCQAINQQFLGVTIDDCANVECSVPVAPQGFTTRQIALFDLLCTAVRQAMAARVEDADVVLEGATEILRQPEFRDASKIEGVLDTLQKGAFIFQMASRAQCASRTTVVIGSENSVTTLRECSVVTAPYFVGTRQRGSIGVVGPTRMNYDRAIPAVGFFARTLSQTLTRLSLQ